jgi:hypothetical protein
MDAAFCLYFRFFSYNETTVKGHTDSTYTKNGSKTGIELVNILKGMKNLDAINQMFRHV